MFASNTTRATARFVLAAVLLVAVAATSACATAKRRESDFELAQRKYTQLVRWSAFGEAEAYVVPEGRDAFNEVTQALGGISFMDYRIRSLDFDEENNEATARVVYSAYRRTTASAISLEEEQIWKRDEATQEWAVRSTFVEKAFNSERRD